MIAKAGAIFGRAEAPVRHTLPFRCAPRRFVSSNFRSAKEREEANLRIAIYATATVVTIVGISYAAVPLYQIFCQATGYGGTTQQATEERFKNMKPVEGARQLTVHFTADTHDTMPWVFRPLQHSVKVVPGETALAFYSAYNPTDKPITGVSTYNIVPMRAGLYFSKIQCFCFEEQRLRPHEEIDMPVFFYVDPKFLDDPAMANVKELTLSYTFFRTGEMDVLDIDTELHKRQGLLAHGNNRTDMATASSDTQEKVRQWAEQMAQKTGVKLPQSDAAASGVSASTVAAATPVVQVAAAAGTPLAPTASV